MLRVLSVAIRSSLTSHSPPSFTDTCPTTPSGQAQIPSREEIREDERYTQDTMRSASPVEEVPSMEFEKEIASKPYDRPAGQQQGYNAPQYAA